MMRPTSSLMRSAVLRTSVRPAVRSSAIVTLSAATRVNVRNFTSTRKCLCGSCASSSSSGQACARHSRVVPNTSTINASKAAAYATTAGPDIPKEQWAQVLEQVGGRMFYLRGIAQCDERTKKG